jgi:hypothetical protein
MVILTNLGHLPGARLASGTGSANGFKSLIVSRIILSKGSFNLRAQEICGKQDSKVGRLKPRK